VIRGPEYKVTLDGAIDATHAEAAPRRSGLGAMFRPKFGAPRYPGGRGASPYASGRPADLLYLLDMHEDMHGLVPFLRNIARKMPGLRIMVVHLPGMAGTEWDEHPVGLDPAVVAMELGSSAARYEALL